MNLRKSVLGMVLAMAFTLSAQSGYQSLINTTPYAPYSFATNVFLGTSDFKVPNSGAIVPGGILCKDSGTVSVITLAGDSCKLVAKSGLNWFPVQVQKIVSASTDSLLRTSSITLYGEITGQFLYTSLKTPVAPVLSTPTSGSTNQPLSMSLSWSTAAISSNYNVYISTSSTFSNTISAYTGVYGTYLNSISVPSSKTLYWRSCGNTIAGSGPWSSTWSFGTTL